MGISFCMLHSTTRNPKMEFVANQLKRVKWISGYEFIPAQGYRLEWLPVGGHRMRLLQIALKESETIIHGLDRLGTKDRESHDAITAFWDACVAQLALHSEVDSLAAFGKIIESWKPH